jgi:hypothetical protein
VIFFSAQTHTKHGEFIFREHATMRPTFLMTMNSWWRTFSGLPTNRLPMTVTSFDLIGQKSFRKRQRATRRTLTSVDTTGYNGHCYCYFERHKGWFHQVSIQLFTACFFTKSLIFLSNRHSSFWFYIYLHSEHNLTFSTFIHNLICFEQIDIL